MLFRAKAPLRVSFAGGGTDVAPFPEREGGLVLNATINRYAYGTLRPRRDENVHIESVDFGTTAKSTPAILPSEAIALAGVTIPSDRLWFAAIVVVLAAVLSLVYRRTRFGLATRASAENEVGAALVGDG